MSRISFDVNYVNIKMSTNDFNRLSKFIYSEYGIKMPSEKKIMLQSRLHKRLRELKISSFEEYIKFVFSKEGEQKELINMIDAVSTNKTDFFREPVHFDFLQEVVLPEFMNTYYNNRTIKFWCAGCSSGEEPYTLAIVLSELIENNKLNDYSIFATDISSQMLKKAANAIYQEKIVADISLNIKKKYFLRSKDSKNRTVRIIPILRNKVSFQRLNFIDDNYNVKNHFDIIFCRNVIIYFDRKTQEKVINKLCLKLKTGGYLFLGHSETIMGMDIPLEQVKPTIYRKV